MGLVRLYVDGSHLFFGDLDTFFVFFGVESGFYAKSARGPSSTNEVHHGLVDHQWLASPVHADERKHPMLDLIPLARSCRIVADRNR